MGLKGSIYASLWKRGEGFYDVFLWFYTVVNMYTRSRYIKVINHWKLYRRRKYQVAQMLK